MKIISQKLDRRITINAVLVHFIYKSNFRIFDANMILIIKTDIPK